jgi:4-amino-4-deoxy-L-arabinose transferase-like glycosyltransferase
MGNQVKAPSILQKVPYSLRMAILVVIVAKILVFSLGYAANYMNDASASPLTVIMNQFNRWDAPHYIDIARNWYINQGDQRNLIVFFPLYPILIRLATVDFSYMSLSALVVSNVSSIIAFVYLFKLAKLDFDDSVALKAVLFLSIFPTAYFLSAPYTEGLFFALVIASVYYARMAKWPLAGFLGMFAALTRMAGLLLLPTLLVEYLHQKGWKPRKIDANILWIGLALVGFLIYLNINNQVTGNPFTFIEIERTHWSNSINPLTGLAQAFGAVNKPFPENITIGVAPLAFAFLGLLAVAGGFVRRLRPSYTVYMLFTWMLAVSTAWWISVPRYVMAMFPMFILLGTLSRRRTVTILITVAFAAALCFFTVLFTLGKWAF